MKNYHYNLFKTQWGWFGLLGNKHGLVRTYLPMAHKEAVKSRILSEEPTAKPSKTSFSALKNKILSYYTGQVVDFSQTKVSLDGATDFQKGILTRLQSVKHGEITTYSQLAKNANKPNAARAIGTVMAKNPMPLIIPCHRVIRTDGKIGRFSAAGGTKTKKRMLELEKQSFCH